LHDKIAGIEAGADDYLIKPFEIQELEVRLRALIRRDRGQISPETFKIADLQLDTGTLQVERAGQRLNLTPISLKILTVLLRASPRVVSRRDIEREVWGDILPDSDTLRSHIYNLRKVIDKPFELQLLHTHQTTGYQIANAEEK
jgi:DNA-binding response OmpR family regulator